MVGTVPPETGSELLDALARRACGFLSAYCMLASHTSSISHHRGIRGPLASPFGVVIIHRTSSCSAVARRKL